MNVLVFDIETVPDVEGGARLYDLDGLAPDEAAKAMTHIRQMEAGTDFLRHYLHRIVAISVVMRSADRLNVWSLGSEASSESDLVARFFDGIARYSPTLVSWNGSGFDLPVLHYRALRHGIEAPRYWEAGAEDSSFRWNNYLNRFHERHTDLMDMLSGYQPRASASLDAMATLLGFPGKLGMSGAHVFEAYQAGNLAGIRDYCETDVLNTYLIYLRFELFRGRLDRRAYALECARVRQMLADDGRKHLEDFLNAWVPQFEDVD
jgi:3'-5' exonuclease